MIRFWPWFRTSPWPSLVMFFVMLAWSITIHGLGWRWWLSAVVGGLYLGSFLDRADKKWGRKI